jgi:hypothetical protein
MGELWEVVVADGATGKEERRPSRAVVLIASSWRGSDIFFARFVGKCVTEKAKLWFEEHVPGHMRFKEVKVA